MMVIPAVDIKGDKCVQLVGGRPGTEQFEIDDVVGIAQRWQNDGAEMIHIIDLDSALGTGDNESLIEEVVGALSVPVQVGGGVRTDEKVHRLFEIGVERVIIGTRAIQERPFVEALANRYSDGIVVAIDSMADQVLIKGWQEGSGRGILSVVQDLDTLPIWGYLYTNVEAEGRLQGISTDPIRALIGATQRPLIVSGGVTTRDDLEALNGMGVHSVVLGMSIYSGTINFKRTVREFS